MDSIAELKKDIFSLPESWEQLKNADFPVCIYGMGDACERILAEFSRRGIPCGGIFASDDHVRTGRKFRGYEVTSLSALEERYGRLTVCCAFGSSLPEVMARIDGIGRRHEVVFPDLPIAGEEFFSREGLAARESLLDEVYPLFADELSRAVFRDVLRFRLTGDLRYLRSAFCDTDPMTELIRPESGEVCADLGAYNGDTAEGFIEACPDYGHIYAFEPDMRSFRKCVKRLMRHDNVTMINACAWSCDRTVGFSQSAGRQSHITGSGRLAAARSLDSVLAGKRCDIIKLDVEGAEREALTGSEDTIRRYRPRLIVSAYHRPYDLLDLPRQIISFDGSYGLYVRQPVYYPAWDTCVCAVR